MQRIGRTSGWQPGQVLASANTVTVGICSWLWLWEKREEAGGAGAGQEAGAMTGCASICYRFHAGWLCAPLLVCPCRVATFSYLPLPPLPPLPPRLLTSCNVFCRPGTSSRHAFYLVVVTHSPSPAPCPVPPCTLLRPCTGCCSLNFLYEVNCKCCDVACHAPHAASPAVHAPS